MKAVALLVSALAIAACSFVGESFPEGHFDSGSRTSLDITKVDTGLYRVTFTNPFGEKSTEMGQLKGRTLVYPVGPTRQAFVTVVSEGELDWSMGEATARYRRAGSK